MGHIAIFETTQYVGDSVDFADVGEELVAQPLAARGSTHQAGDIDKFKLGGDDLLRLRQRGQYLKARIRYSYSPDVRARWCKKGSWRPPPRRFR
jgi:hypothetical protein